MAKLILIVFGLLMVSISLEAQADRMDTDRPDQTESPVITKHNYFQVETGLGLAKENGFPTFTLPTVLWKYGLFKKLELRLFTEIDIVETPLLIPDGNKVTGGLIPMQIGGKLSLFEEKGWIPKTSLIFHLLIPKAATKQFQASKWAPAIILSMQNDFSEKTGIGYNVGFEWDGQSNTPSLVYSLSTGFGMGKRWSSFIEVFGEARKNELSQTSLDTGLGYYINDNLKLDASAGWGLSGSAIDHFYGIGISFRFK